MPSCAIPGCKNSNRNVTTGDIIFHKFPLDSSFRKAWVHSIKRSDQINFKNARVCSTHFRPVDYRNDLQNQLLGLPLRKKGFLLPAAVPSLNLPLQSVGNDSKLLELNDIRCERLNRRAIRKGLLAETRVQHNVPSKLAEVQNENTGVSSEPENVGLKDSEELGIVSSLEERVTQMESTISHLQQQNYELTQQIKAEKSQTARYMSLYVKLWKTNRVFQNVFSEKQICVLTGKKKVKKWGSEDIARALTLRALSKKCYNFLRQEMHIPLPGLSTLQDWTRHFKLSPGVIHEVVLMLQTQLSQEPGRNHICSLSFDEMCIDSKICFDEGAQEVLGPYQKMCVAMARGLCSSWKQPVFFSFDDCFTRESIFTTIETLSLSGIRTKSITSDMGPTNQGIWKDLGVNKNKPYFESCQDGMIEKVFVFPDFPHLLKCLRNAFLDHGISIPVKTSKRKLGRVTERILFGKELLIELLSKDNGEFKILHHLNESDLRVSGQERQRYAPANHVFSEKTAAAIRVFADQKEFLDRRKAMHSIADFVQQMNDYKELMTSSVMKDFKYPLRNAFGVNGVQQSELLRKVKNTLDIIRIPSPKGKLRANLPFMNGIKQSILALQSLSEELFTEGVNYIITKRLTQNCLENLFGQIRGLGKHYDHPPAHEAKNRLRLLLLGQHTLLSKRLCIENEDARVRYVSSLLLKPITNNTVVPQSFEDTRTPLFTDTAPPLMEESDQAKSFAETEGETYVAGYIAAKIHKRYPGTIKLGTPTGQLSAGVSPWIGTLSCGGLTQPSPEWMSTFRKLDKVFSRFHGGFSEINRTPGIINNLIKNCEEACPELSREVIRLFARTRTFIRIDFANFILQKKKVESKQRGLKRKATGKEILPKSTKIPRTTRKTKQWAKSNVKK